MSFICSHPILPARPKRPSLTSLFTTLIQFRVLRFKLWIGRTFKLST
jgi:hypothetical protein